MVDIAVVPYRHLCLGSQDGEIGDPEYDKARGCFGGWREMGKKKIYSRYSLTHRRQKLATITTVPRKMRRGMYRWGSKAGARVLGRRNSKGPVLCNSVCACVYTNGDRAETNVSII